ncbi:MAG: hypothetical protein IKE33_05835 [Erysipelotrichaceae bacterium]|nr:hypothetical protein [Erysipelotrichaceae bacterium]
MNDYLKYAVVSYETEEQRNQLEDYLSGKSGRKVDLSGIKGLETCTILSIRLDLSEINSLTVMGAIARSWSGEKSFGSGIDEFIDWYDRISNMHYPEAVAKAKHRADVIALYYNEEVNEISYICFRMFDRKDIENYLVSSTGKALPIDIADKEYWLLESDVNGNKILFSRDEDEDSMPFDSISTDQKDIDLFKYLITL